MFDDKVNEFTALAAGYDGFVFGSPSSQNPHPFRIKPAAAVVSARRAGTTSALDQMNKYFFHQQMPIATRGDCSIDVTCRPTGLTQGCFSSAFSEYTESNSAKLYTFNFALCYNYTDFFVSI